jgi:EpsI family protein
MPNKAGNLTMLGRGLLIAMTAILLLQATAVRKLSIQERDVPIPELRQVPIQLGDWKAQGDQTLDAAQAEVLKPDDYIIRDYREVNGDNVNLFVAHFRSLQDSYGPHSPRICLPGAGWLIASSRIASIPVQGSKPLIPVNEYLLEKGGARIFVVYWYQNNRDTWAEEFRAKLNFLPDLIRYRRSDVSLVRLITSTTENDRQARGRCQEFAKLVYPRLAERFAANQ